MPMVRKITDQNVIKQINSAKQDTVKIKVNMRAGDRIDTYGYMYTDIVAKYRKG